MLVMIEERRREITKDIANLEFAVIDMGLKRMLETFYTSFYWH